MVTIDFDKVQDIKFKLRGPLVFRQLLNQPLKIHIESSNYNGNITVFSDKPFIKYPKLHACIRDDIQLMPINCHDISIIMIKSICDFPERNFSSMTMAFMDNHHIVLNVNITTCLGNHFGFDNNSVIVSTN